MQREIEYFFDKLFDFIQENKVVSPLKVFNTNDKIASLNLENLIIVLKKVKLDQKSFTSCLDSIIKKYKSTIKGDIINLDSLLADFKSFTVNKNKDIKLKKLKEKQTLIDTPSASPDSSPRKTVKWKDEEVKILNLDEDIKKKEEETIKRTESNKELSNSFQYNFKEFDLLGSTVLSPLEKIILVEKKIQQDIVENNNYKLLRLYEYFCFFTEKFGSSLEQAFIFKNPQQDGYLKKIEFDNIFRSHNIFLTDESKLLIFNDLPSKENSRYSYKAFLEKIYNYKKETLENQIRSFNHMYNEYVVLLRKHVRDQSRKIDIPVIVRSNFPSEEININEFFKLLWMIGFIISEKENEYLFNILSERGNTIKLTALMNILYLDPLDLQVMRNSVNKTKHLEKLKAWKERIITFDQERALDYRKHYIFLESIMKSIQTNLQLRNINNIVDIFTNMEINEQGECDESSFINAFSKYNLQQHKDFVIFIDYFLNKNNYKIDLCAMINAYNAVLFDQRKLFQTVKENYDKINPNIYSYKSQLNTSKKEMTTEDIENIRETSNFIIEIINKEKFMTYKEYFKQADKKNCGYFTIQQFLAILEELEIETNGESAESLNIFFDYVIEDKIKNIITLEKLFKTFNLMGCQDNEVNKKFSSVEEKFTSDFGNYLLYNRIKFTSLFPGKKKDDIITRIDIINAFTISKYAYNERELNSFISMLDGRKTGRFTLNHIKKIISLVVPEYFDKPFQNIDEEAVAKEIRLKDTFKVILEKMNRYIRDHRLSIREFFDLIPKVNNSEITLKEFNDLIHGFVDKEYSNKDLKEVFDFLDKDKSNTLSISELIPFLESAKLSVHEKKKKIVIPNTYLEDVNKLFDHFDTNKDGKLSKQEFTLALKSVNKGITEKEIEKILKNNHFISENYFSRNDYNIIMQDNIMQELISIENEKEQIINLFKEEDTNKIGFLTLKQFSNLLKEKLNCQIADKELEELIHTSDSNFNGLIEIDEFINLIKTLDRLKMIKSVFTKEKTTITSFLNIFHGLPNIFSPSFIRDQEKRGRILPSSTIYPITDKTGILYLDILPDNDKTFQTKTTVRPINYLVLKPIETVVCCKINFVKATGIPVLDRSFLSDGVIYGRQLKICFYNKFLQSYFGNTITIDCKWNEDYKDKWTFYSEKDSINNNLLIRFNEKEDKYIYIMFEFVLIVGKDKNITEISSGWSEINIFDLMKRNKFTLDVEGGTPEKKIKIEKKDIITNPDGKSKVGWSKIKSLFNEEIKSQLLLESIQFKNMNEDEKTTVNYLPITIIIPKVSLNICSVYRKYIGKFILNNSNYLKKPIKYQGRI